MDRRMLLAFYGCIGAPLAASPRGATATSGEEMRITIVPDDLSGSDIAALLAHHLADMHLHSPACKVHALPIERLREQDVSFFSAWRDERLVGCGALKELDGGHGELKSMRAAPEARGTGVGAALLAHLLDEARRRGYRRVSLETGRGPAFAAAIRLYERNGFHECPPFAGYASDQFSKCMTKEIA
jgi:putative acetyltransferase